MADNVIVRVPEQQFIRGEDGYSPVVTIQEIEHGHSVNITDREHQAEGQTFNVLDGASAYEQAVAGGYEGTEAEFNADLAGFSEKAQTATSAAASAAQNAQNAAGSASTATTKAQEAAESAATALTRMNSANSSAQAAANSATAAGNAKTAAEAALASIPEALIQVSSTQPTEPVNKLWINDGNVDEYTIPTYSEFNELKNAFDTRADSDAVQLYPRYVNATYPTGNVGDTVAFTSSTNWRLSSLDVNEKCLYCFKVITYKNSVYCVYFVDSAEKILAKYAVGNSPDQPEMVEYIKVAAPANAVKVYLTKHSKTSGDVCEAWVYNPPNVTSISILCTNCGRFNYGDGTTTLETYKNRWRTMFIDNPIDIIGLEDFQQSFGDGSGMSAESTLFADTLRMPLHSIGDGVGLSCGAKSGLLTFYKQIDVEQSTTRHIVTHYKYLINGILIDIFLGHFQPNQSGAEQRAIQYANIIQEMAKYQNVIMMGDFNAWTESEYDIFKQNGYKIANGGYLPIQNTLRDIPADNIVYSSNFSLKSSKVLDSYNLNTDHYPIYVSLSIN